ncbi:MULTISPECIES: GNAT family N-acetyltransferase [Paenibacillus]|nr:GNAT family N-acetyltransferase [Paenibacillus lactis]
MLCLLWHPNVKECSILYTYRPLNELDLELICGFPQTPEELFYMSPRSGFPLTPQQVMDLLENRLEPTVIVEASTDRPVAYANFYDVKDGSAWLGNVIVAPDHRGKGASKELLQTMMRLAKTKYGVNSLHLSCHNTNTRGLVFYHKQGFKPYEVNITTLNGDAAMITIQMKRDLTEL